MKKLGLLILATAFVFGTGFLKKNEDGSTSLDTASLQKQADKATAKAQDEMEKAATQAEAAKQKAIEETKKAVEKINVKAEDIKADLAMSADQIKAKIDTFKEDQLLAYAEKYKAMFAEKKAQVADYTQKVKDLKWTEKWSKKGRELKSQLKEYKGQLGTLGEQYQVYADKLKAMDIDLSSFGLSDHAE